MKKIGIIRRIVISLLACTACVLPSAAQDSFTIEAPSVVSTGEIFSIMYVATYEDGRVSDFSLPDLEGMEVLAGPAPSTSMSFQSSNGKSSTVRTQSYTYTVSVGTEGYVTIPSASVKIGGKLYESGTKTVEVIKGTRQDSGNGQESATLSAGDDIKLVLTVSKTKAVVGEPVTATLKLYVQSSTISGFEDVRFPSFDGFWSQETDSPQNIHFEREKYDGDIYNAALLCRYMLLPQQTGDLSIDPAELVCLLQVRSLRSGPRSVFDDFFDSYQTVRKRVTSEPVTIHVSPLPSGAPESFTGGVGSFSMSVSFDKDSVSAHEASSLKVTVSGTGNLGLINAPEISFPSDFEVYDMKKTDNIKAGGSGSSGTVTFEYPFIPRAPGTFSLSPVEFTYYDISSGRYRTISSEPLEIKVGEGNRTDAAVIPSGVNKQSVKNIGEDIRFMATSPGRLRASGRLVVDTPVIYVVPLLTIILFVVSWILLARMAERRGDVAGTRNRKALKVARARLKNASMFLKQGLYSAFYEELHKAVEGYVSDKLMLPVADLTRDRIEDELKARGRSGETVKELFDLLDACEYARYAPAGGTDAMDRDYRQAEKVISEIES